MIELIVIIILVGSLIGIGMIAFRKIPDLVELPETQSTFIPKKIFFELKEKIRNFNYFKNFSTEIFLQKILSKIRVVALKIENKIASYLQKLRESSTKKKVKENDNYWKELKDSTRK